MTEFLEHLTLLGPKLGNANNTRLQKCVEIAKKGDLGPLATFVTELERGAGLLTSSEEQSVSEFDILVLTEVDFFKTMAEGKNSDLVHCVRIVENLFLAQRDFLEKAGKSRKPSDDVLNQMLEPTANFISEIQAYREKKRCSPVFNHLSMISESVPALGWVGVTPAPAPYVRELKDAGQFYANRVLRESKADKDLVDSWIEILTRLADFVKKNHTTGLQWNRNGAEYIPKMDDSRQPNKSFLHEQPKEQLPKKKAVVYGAGSAKGGVEKLELDGKKWMVEYFKGNSNIKVTAQANQSIYIFKCENAVIKVDGKCNNIILNSCKKVGVVFDSLISSAEVVNSASIELQVLGTVPIVTLDKTDSVQIYLSEQSKNCEIVTAKTAGVNITVPQPSGDSKEFPVPEQFKTIVNGGKLKTTPMESF
ncbi:adenylyl cyclase-associated protein [Eurytemora carolleeae]|uniref:adenylyl cyclase-associated protein n=1 Tax=Eurytemora carolleeae TaxID=1294199 RepID=UPI000C75EB7E|nr:adenylyl cyclase-associated protein [Eurytemora carolleeae]XP_023335822.1 adenylyl cyclase-associated protein [Eurytemora carolleeae]|eukprot:XP_023335821.1 adenylyl cyclase-associated protein-like [Eurytemora affinis]